MEVKFAFIISLLIPLTYQSNVLIVSLLTSHSHHFWNEAIAVGLVEKGHNVTMLSYDRSKINHINYTVITLEGIFDEIEKGFTSEFLGQFHISPMNIPRSVDAMFDFDIFTCQLGLNNPTFHTFLNGYPMDFKFDLILWDHTAGTCMYPIIERFGNPPIMGLSPYGLTNNVEDIYGGHVYSYVGQVTMPFVEATGIWERFLNVFYINYAYLSRRIYFKPKIVDLARTVFPDWSIQKFNAIEDRFSICLLNWHIAVNQPQPLAPSFIPVGGVQINANKRLPEEFEEIFKQSELGVIYFSMGSLFKSEKLTINVLQVMMDCFNDLPKYQIIWKLKPPTELRIPHNVHTVDWAPQTAILNEEKTHLFISHGGGLSTQETSYFGVPVLGIPVFLDQINNIQKLRHKGVAEFIDLEHLQLVSENANKREAMQLFCGNVKQVLENPEYRERMKQISVHYQDLPIKPLDAAIYWIEYVIRHKGASHLNIIARKFNNFKSQNLDLYLIGLAAFVLLLVVSWGIFKILRQMFILCTRSMKVKIL